jgi:DNA-binding response OmpR family regulator
MTQHMCQNILVIEDDPDLGALICGNLRDARTEVKVERHGTVGLRLAASRRWDLLIVDWMLPGTNGLKICRTLRAAADTASIILLTARDSEQDRVEGLDAGADDYLSKPFGIAELKARVRAQLRRSARGGDSGFAQPEPAEVQVGSLHLDARTRVARLQGRDLCLTSREFELLLFLARNPSVAHSRDQLLQKIWGPGFDGYAHTVNSHINRLRGKLEVDPSRPPLIATVWGKGYRLAPEGAA